MCPRAGLALYDRMATSFCCTYPILNKARLLGVVLAELRGLTHNTF
jgi:hypothetical protein